MGRSCRLYLEIRTQRVRCRGRKCSSHLTWSVVQWEAFLNKCSYSGRHKSRPSGSSLLLASLPLPPSAFASSEAGRRSPSSHPSSLLSLVVLQRPVCPVRRSILRSPPSLSGAAGARLAGRGPSWVRSVVGIRLLPLPTLLVWLTRPPPLRPLRVRASGRARCLLPLLVVLGLTVQVLAVTTLLVLVLRVWTWGHGLHRLPNRLARSMVVALPLSFGCGGMTTALVPSIPSIWIGMTPFGLFFASFGSSTVWRNRQV